MSDEKPGPKPKYSDAMMLRAKAMRDEGMRWKLILREMNLPEAFAKAYRKRIEKI